jgi:outer membrane immunogenic protein
MKKFLLASAAVVALATPSFAADFGSRPFVKAAPPVGMGVANWNGFYVGAMGGYGWSDEVRASVAGLGSVAVSTDELKGGFGGGTFGYNGQSGRTVLGLEIDAAGGDIAYHTSAFGATFRDRINALGSVTGRVGIAADSLLFYAKGGYAWANNRAAVDVAGVNIYSESKLHSGWTIGGGLEWMFAPQWSAKAEYMFADFGKENYASAILPPGIDVGASIHTVKVGVNYHFGGPY